MDGINIIEIEAGKELIDFEKTCNGIKIVTENYNTLERKILKSEAGQFAKWVKNNYSKISIDYNSDAPKLVLRNDEFWFPLVYLAADVSLHFFLDIILNYLFSKIKGALKGEEKKAIVHIKAEFKDQKEGKYKRFVYEGPASKLKDINIEELLK